MISAYSERPWLALYREGDAPDLDPGNGTAADMFAAAVAAAPEATAIHYFDAELSWSTLDELSAGLAAGLQRLGVEKGDRVAVYLQNVPQFAIAMAAIWKVGAVLLTINPMMKERELTKQLGEIEPKVLIALESLYGDVGQRVVREQPVGAVITTSELDFLEGAPPPQLSGSRRQRFEGCHDLLELAGEMAGVPIAPVDLSPGDLAQVMYTSGSTGLPKAAMSTHRNVVFNANAYRRWLDLGEGDVCLGAMPLVHVTGPIGYLGAAMTVPIPVVLAYRFDPGQFLRDVERHRATYTVLSPTGLVSVMTHPESATRDISSLTKICSGVVEQPMDDWEKQFGVYVLSIYGATECTSPTHIVPLGRRAPKRPETGKRAVGIPIYETQAKVVDDVGAEVPVGELGEIVVSGPQVGLGYWNHPDVSAFRDGVYYTGDIGYMDPDGWFFVVDRKKDMIDASGFKVAPLEVENVLYDHPAVREAAVIGVPDAYRGQTVKAFVSLEPGAEVSEEELITYSKKRMAAYKYPRIVEVWDDLPKSDIGKIVKSELPKE